MKFLGIDILKFLGIDIRRSIGLGVVAALVATAAVCWGADKGASAREARAKARYYYSAGMVHQAAGNNPQAYEYFKKAWQADPSYVEAGTAYGMRRLGVLIDTLQSERELLRSLDLMRAYTDAYPGDQYEAQMYAYAATQLGREDEAVQVLERTASLHPQSASLLGLLSEAHAHAGDLHSAVEALDRLERLSGPKTEVTMRKLSYLLAARDTAATMAEVDRFVEKSPVKSYGLVLKGNIYSIINQPDSAFYYYQKAEQLDPEAGAPKLALAEYYNSTGDSTAYDTKMYELLLTEDLGLDQKKDLVASYLQTLITSKGETKRGDHLFSVLLSQFPHEPSVRDLAARYNAAKGDMESAIDDISYALDQDPTNATYWGQLMLYQAADGHHQAAMQTYERAKSHIEPDENLKIAYANVAVGAKDYTRAEKVYVDMIHEIEPKLHPDSLASLSQLNPAISVESLDRLSTLYATIGDIKHEAGDPRAAYRAYENALLFNSDNALAANNYAYFLSIDGGDLNKALDLAKHLYESPAGGTSTYIDTYAWILHLLDRNEEAESVQRKAMEALESESYKSPELYDHLGDIVAANGKWGEALDAWEKAKEYYEKYEETDSPEYKSVITKIKEGKSKAEKEEKSEKKEGLTNDATNATEKTT